MLSARKTLDDYGVEAKLFTPTDHMITGIVHGPAIFCETRTKLVFADAAERDQAISNIRAVARSETRYNNAKRQKTSPSLWLIN